MIVILSNTKSLFLSIKPLYINWSFCSWKNLTFEIIYSIFSACKRTKFHKSTPHKFLIFLHKFDIKNLTVFLEKCTNVIFTPAYRKITYINNEFYFFQLEFLSRCNRTVRSLTIGMKLFWKFWMNRVWIKLFFIALLFMITIILLPFDLMLINFLSLFVTFMLLRTRI